MTTSERAEAVVERLKKMVEELGWHPGIEISRSEVLGPMPASVLAVARSAMGCELPEEMVAFYALCGGVDVAWRTAEPGLRPSDRIETGKLRLLELSNDSGSGVFDERDPDTRSFKAWRVDVWDSDAYVALCQTTPETPPSLQLCIGDQEPADLGIGFLEYVDLAVACRGLRHWPVLVLPSTDAKSRARKTMVARYLFSDWEDRWRAAKVSD